MQTTQNLSTTIQIFWRRIKQSPAKLVLQERQTESRHSSLPKDLRVLLCRFAVFICLGEKRHTLFYLMQSCQFELSVQNLRMVSIRNACGWRSCKRSPYPSWIVPQSSQRSVPLKGSETDLDCLVSSFFDLFEFAVFFPVEGDGSVTATKNYFVFSLELLQRKLKILKA